MIGRTLGHYRIAEKLGEGGMGVVYLARDTRLGREVAIKVLPEAFARDAERLARFEREAQLLASLNHPNIAAIYGLEEQNGVRYLVLEFVPGETLGQRLKAGPLPVEEALTLGKQMAEALEAAHEKGIVHRDLKPANVKVTPEGKVKVLDFGLAKAFEGDVPGADLSQSPTLSLAATRAGVILGTAAYMSPEQARGKPVDRRADIWAFGCVLYEALAGRQAFGGETASDSMARILARDADWNALPESTPESIRRLLRRCLQKDPARRMHDFADVRIELEEAPAEPFRPIVPEERKQRRPAILWGVVGLVAGAVASGALAWILSTLRPPDDSTVSPVRRVVVRLPESESLGMARYVPLAIGRSQIAISPDGRHLAYIGVHNAKAQLYVRPLDQFEARAISGTEGAYNPFFSPDSHSVAFFVENKLKKVALTGGEPVTICEARNPHGASWGSDGNIVFSAAEGSAVVRVPSGGGKVEVIPCDWWWWCYAPESLPGGKGVLVYMAKSKNPSYAEIGLLALDTHKWTTLLQGGASPKYVSSGHLVFARGGALLAAPFDLASLKLTGPAVTVVEGVRSEVWGEAHFAVSQEGTLVYVPGIAGWVGKPVWVDRQGRVTPMGAPTQTYGTFRLSPDGRRLAIEVAEATDDVWVYDLERGTFVRLTTEGRNSGTVWTPDGRRVTFASDKDGKVLNIYWQSADGSGTQERLTTSDRWQNPTSWSPDGKLLLHEQAAPGGGSDLWVLHLDDRKAAPFLHTEFEEWGGVFSPDGRWIAYTSDESGRSEVYVRPYPGPGGKWQISTEGGEEPAWGRDGRELFYRNGEKWMVASVQTQGSFSAAAPRVMFEGDFLNVSGRSFDVAPDSRRLVMIQVRGQDPAPKQLHVVLNWFAKLQGRLPKVTR